MWNEYLWHEDLREAEYEDQFHSLGETLGLRIDQNGNAQAVARIVVSEYDSGAGHVTISPPYRKGNGIVRKFGSECLAALHARGVTAHFEPQTGGGIGAISIPDVCEGGVVAGPFDGATQELLAGEDGICVSDANGYGETATGPDDLCDAVRRLVTDGA